MKMPSTNRHAKKVVSFPSFDDEDDVPDTVPLIVGGIPIMALETPVLFEDEGQEEMGDSAPHSTATQILSCGIEAHVAARVDLQVFTNLNLMYHPIRLRAYVSPDVMVVAPDKPLSATIRSYRTGKHGPAPRMVLEVLSERTAQQGDLTSKPNVYADSKIPEYILVDSTGEFLPERILLRKLTRAGKWTDHQDDDGGITSALGFRIIFDEDGILRVTNAKTGFRYVRPREATPLFMDLNEKYETERAKAYAEAKRAETECKKALRALASEEQAVAEARRTADENKRLRAEIEKLRKRLPPDQRG